jgi:hypothetical protein
MAVATPHFTALLTLSPSTFEDDFRASDTFDGMAKALDMWSLYITIIANTCWLVFWQDRLLGQGHQQIIVANLGFIALGLGQYTWSTMSPCSYVQHRTQLRVFNR